MLSFNRVAVGLVACLNLVACDGTSRKEKETGDKSVKHLHIPGVGDVLVNQLGDGITEALGIRYAAPPVGRNRFRPPQPLEHGDSDQVDATAYGPRCMAPTVDQKDQSEDCLSLNIWAPAQPTNGKLLPVLVWIHGGFWMIGSGRDSNSTALAKEGVIAVTINYRLGIFGFLESEEISKENPDAPGNGAVHGILDQLAALRWVAAHISAFGGDPKQVTIAGQSAGSFSVCAHLHLQASAGLFHRAIQDSGICTENSPIMADWNKTKHKSDSDNVFKGLNATKLEDLRGMPADKIGKFQIMIGPSVDGFYLKKLPSALPLASKNVDIMIGSNTMDSLIAPPYNRPPPLPSTTSDYKALMKSYFGEFIFQMYPAPPEGASQLDVRRALYRMNSDVMFTCPKMWAIPKYVDSGGNVFMYNFGFEDRVDFKGYACHACELPNVFPDAWNLNASTWWVKGYNPKLSKDMLFYWAQFVKDGLDSINRSPPAKWAPIDKGLFWNISMASNGDYVSKLDNVSLNFHVCDQFKEFISKSESNWDRFSLFGRWPEMPKMIAPESVPFFV